VSAWIDQIFKARVAKNGGVVRRKKSSVHKYASHYALVRAVKRRRFHLIEIGDWYVILCNTGDMRVIR
jgi:hypothetical protein